MPGRKLIVMLSAPSPKKLLLKGKLETETSCRPGGRWQTTKPIGLTACDGLPIDYVVGLNRNPNSGAAVDYEARRLGGECPRENLASCRARRCAPARRVRQIAAAQNFRI